RAKVRTRCLFVAVVADRFDRATLEGLHAERDLLLGGRLFVDERIATLVMPGEEPGGGFTAQVTVDALLIDVELARDVLVPLVCFVGHRSPEKERIEEGCQVAARFDYRGEIRPRSRGQNSGAGLSLPEAIPTVPGNAFGP